VPYAPQRYRPVGGRAVSLGADGIEVCRRQWPRTAAVVGLVVCAILVFATGGCGDEGRMVRVDVNSFQKVVLDSPQPVLVDFYKDDCPICWPLDPALRQLAEEYDGRVTVARFMIMTGHWTITSKETRNKYHIFYVPTVILFDKGVEVNRWNVVYAADPYRCELEKMLKARGDETNPQDSRLQQASEGPPQVGRETVAPRAQPAPRDPEAQVPPLEDDHARHDNPLLQEVETSLRGP
jgi:thioredoxin 1